MNSSWKLLTWFDWRRRGRGDLDDSEVTLVAEWPVLMLTQRLWAVQHLFSCLVSQGGLLSGASLCQALHRPRVRRQDHQHQEALGQRWEQERHWRIGDTWWSSMNTTKKQRVIMCVSSWILKHTLTYFSACLIPAFITCSSERGRRWLEHVKQQNENRKLQVCVSLIVNLSFQAFLLSSCFKLSAPVSPTATKQHLSLLLIK